MSYVLKKCQVLFTIVKFTDFENGTNKTTNKAQSQAWLNCLKLNCCIRDAMIIIKKSPPSIYTSYKTVQFFYIA